MRSAVAIAESIFQDIQYGARLLRRSPWFTCVGVASLGLGLGGGITLFIAMNAIVLRPLPGHRTSDLHAIYTANRGGSRYGGSSYLDFQSFTSADLGLFAASCATTNVRGNLAVDANLQPLDGAIVSGGCFDALGVRPHLGRLLSPLDDIGNGGSVALVIGHGLWTRSFAADPNVIGRSVLVNGDSAVVVGVAERGFTGVSLDGGAEFWAPAPMATSLLSPRTLTARGDRRFRIYARLRDGVTRAHAAERLALVAAGLRSDDPDAWADQNGATRTVTIAPELEARFAGSAGAFEAIVTGTFGAIAVLVAMTCVNLATMILARGAARRHELNVRLAVGASRGRLLRQLATESLLISAGGALVGLLIAVAGLRVFDAYRPTAMPAVNAAIDWRVIAFAMVIAVFAPVLFGVAPGAHALRLAIAEGLKGRPLITRHRRIPIGSRELLLAVQIVASFALLVASGLFLRALISAEPGLPGLSTRSVAVVPIDLNTAARAGADPHRTIERLLDAAYRVPGVEASALAAIVPMTGSYIGFSGPDAAPSLDGNVVSPGYFEVVGIPLRAGRTFDDRDRARASPVLIVSESIARRFWDTTTAIGRTLRIDDVDREVVGVVADVPYRSVTDASHLVVYLPAAQSAPRRFLIHARVRNEGEAIAALDRAVRTVDTRVLVGNAISMRQLFDQTKIGGRVAQGLGAIGGLLQLGLAVMATWGLVAYAVERRTSEIAIRRALGATEGRILRLVMGPSLWLLAMGAPLGCLAGIIAATLLHATFLGLAPIQLVMAVPAAGVLVPVVIGAAWLPARRALAVEPAAALKAW